jgi:hypothetical protein
MGEKNDDEEGHLRKRADIEKEIRERQERWRKPALTETPPALSGGNDAVAPAGDAVAEDEEPPPQFS